MSDRIARIETEDGNVLQMKGTVYNFRFDGNQVEGLDREGRSMVTGKLNSVFAVIGKSVFELDPGPPPVKQHTPTRCDCDFGWALEVLKKGGFVKRAGWNGKGQYLGLQRPDPQSANTLPYIYIITARGERGPWLASQPDMLSMDWEPHILGMK